MVFIFWTWRGLRKPVLDRYVGIWVLICVISALLPARGFAASFSGPYCGVYSVYGALAAQGKIIDFETLLSTEYISIGHGSTAADLKRAIADHGFNCLELTGLTPSSLSGSPCPVILLVAAGSDSREFNHWLLYLGDVGGRARIAGADGSPEEMSYAELLAIWNGFGLFVSPNPISTNVIRLPSFFENGVYLLCIAAAGCFASRCCMKWNIRSAHRRHAKSFGAHTAIITLISAGVSVATHARPAIGFLANMPNVRQVASARLSDYFTTTTAAIVYQRLQSGTSVIVDARLKSSYSIGHIPGAINVPIDSSTADRHAAMSGIHPETSIVVYCQSRNCPWARAIANRLVRDGFKRIELLTGGWEEWKESYGLTAGDKIVRR
jgi:rhodanese-related sulfurtransferase